jgi:hypothetical protein
VGTIIGHKTQDKYFLGFLADKYSFNKTQSDLDELRPILDVASKLAQENINEPESIDRTVGEQIFKGVGDSIGLAANVVLYGLPQAALLLQTAGKHYQKWRIESVVVPFAKTLFSDTRFESQK